HAHTIHMDVVGYIGTGCDQPWQYTPTMLMWREVQCEQGLTRIFDTSVTPNVPLCLGSNVALQPFKAVCDPSCPNPSSLEKGNPVDVTHQNKQQVEVDYVGTGNNPLRMARTFNSQLGRYRIASIPGALGIGWSATYFQRLEYYAVSIGSTVLATVRAY